MIDSTLIIPTDVKDFGTIFDNEDAVIDDVSDHASVIDLPSVHIDINLMLNSDQTFRQTTFFNIQASCYSQ